LSVSIYNASCCVFFFSLFSYSNNGAEDDINELLGEGFNSYHAAAFLSQLKCLLLLLLLPYFLASTKFDMCDLSVFICGIYKEIFVLKPHVVYKYTFKKSLGLNSSWKQTGEAYQ